VLWRCWLGGRKGIRPVKTEWWGAGVVVCLKRVADLHMAQLMTLPLTVSCFSKIQIGFHFLVLAHPGSPRKRAVKRVCVSFLLGHRVIQLVVVNIVLFILFLLLILHNVCYHLLRGIKTIIILKILQWTWTKFVEKDCQTQIEQGGCYRS